MTGASNSSSSLAPADKESFRPSQTRAAPHGHPGIFLKL
jgi:hypothetical protein